MRPRISSFGKITYSEINEYLIENCVYGFTAKRNEKTIVYSFNMMFRKNKENPEMLYLEVSSSSKLVLKAWTSKGTILNNVEELKQYTKKLW